MAPAYKLTYFNGRGLAESIRFLFHYGGVDFEDNRFERDQWPELKEKIPFGQVPTLEHKGKVINQSVAISRYVAKQVGLAGNNDFENLEIDAVVDTFSDMRGKLLVIFREADEDKKKIVKEKVWKEEIPFYLTRFETLAKQNNGYLAVGRLTWADLCFTCLTQSLESLFGMPDALSDYPNLSSLRDKVLAIPNIKKWVDARPVTEF